MNNIFRITIKYHDVVENKIMNDKFLCSGIDLIAPQRMSFNRKGSSFNITTTHIKKLVIEKIK